MKGDDPTTSISKTGKRCNKAVPMHLRRFAGCMERQINDVSAVEKKEMLFKWLKSARDKRIGLILLLKRMTSF
jgi:hypothetical protein